MLRLLVIFTLLRVLAGPAMAGGGVAFPVHGNWCGPKHESGPVLDRLDAACRRHDLCTFATRNYDCGCDLAFMDELRRMPWPSEALYRKGRAVYEAIALVPCVGSRAQQTTKLVWLRQDTVGAVARGREAPGAAFARVIGLIGRGLAGAYAAPD